MTKVFEVRRFFYKCPTLQELEKTFYSSPYSVRIQSTMSFRWIHVGEHNFLFSSPVLSTDRNRINLYCLNKKNLNFYVKRT